MTDLNKFIEWLVSVNIDYHHQISKNGSIITFDDEDRQGTSAWHFDNLGVLTRYFFDEY